MSRASGSHATWVDPSFVDGAEEWVEPSREWQGPLGLPPLDDAIAHEGHAFDVDPFFDCWDGDEWVGEEVGDDDQTTTEEASRILAEMLIDNYHRGNLHATDLCRYCYWMMVGGMVGAVTHFAKKPGLHSSRYSSHVKTVLGLTGEGETLDHLSIPCSDANDGSRMEYRLPVPTLGSSEV